MWKILEYTEEEGHPLGCRWEPICASRYDIILSKEFFDFSKFEHLRIRFRVSDVYPGAEYRDPSSLASDKGGSE